MSLFEKRATDLYWLVVQSFENSAEAEAKFSKFSRVKTFSSALLLIIQSKSRQHGPWVSWKKRTIRGRAIANSNGQHRIAAF